MLFRTHQTFTRQRAQLFVTLRSHLYEHGIVLAKGNAVLLRFRDRMTEETDHLPPIIGATAELYFHQIEQLTQSLRVVERELEKATASDEDARRARTIPGVGPISAAAFLAFAPPMEAFKCGRDFAAWLGLVPRQHSTGGKPRLGQVSKMGQADLRRLLVIGATCCIRWAKAKGIQARSWLDRLLMRKPAKMAAVALANKMARIIWALISRKETYRGDLIQYV